MSLSDVVKLKNLILDLALPRADVVLFGVICPYCGKNDRIRRLESPEELAKDLEETTWRNYQQLWNEVQEGEADLAVCKFCHNVIFLNDQKNPAIYQEKP